MDSDPLIASYLDLSGKDLQNLIVAGFKPTEEWKQEWIRRHPLSTGRIEQIFKGGNRDQMRQVIDRHTEFPTEAATSSVLDTFMADTKTSEDMERVNKMFFAFGKRLQNKMQQTD